MKTVTITRDFEPKTPILGWTPISRISGPAATVEIFRTNRRVHRRDRRFPIVTVTLQGRGITVHRNAKIAEKYATRVAQGNDRSAHRYQEFANITRPALRDAGVFLVLALTLIFTFALVADASPGKSGDNVPGKECEHGKHKKNPHCQEEPTWETTTTTEPTDESTTTTTFVDNTPPSTGGPSETTTTTVPVTVTIVDPPGVTETLPDLCPGKPGTQWEGQEVPCGSDAHLGDPFPDDYCAPGADETPAGDPCDSDTSSTSIVRDDAERSPAPPTTLAPVTTSDTLPFTGTRDTLRNLGLSAVALIGLGAAVLRGARYPKTGDQGVPWGSVED